MKENNINALMVKPQEHPKRVIIPNNITAFNHLVSLDCYYTCKAEIIVIENGIGILRNSEGALLDLKGNRKINGEIIAGTFFVISFDEHGFITSLSEENIKKYSASLHSSGSKSSIRFLDLEIYILLLIAVFGCISPIIRSNATVFS